MYLLIFEDGEIKKCSEIDQTDLVSSDDGLLDIIDIGNANPKQYTTGEWHEIHEDITDSI